MIEKVEGFDNQVESAPLAHREVLVFLIVRALSIVKRSDAPASYLYAASDNTC